MFLETASADVHGISLHNQLIFSFFVMATIERQKAVYDLSNNARSITGATNAPTGMFSCNLRAEQRKRVSLGYVHRNARHCDR